MAKIRLWKLGSLEHKIQSTAAILFLEAKGYKIIHPTKESK